MKRILSVFILSIAIVVSSLCGAGMVAAQSVDFIATDVCYGEQTTLQGTYSSGDTAVANWAWDLDNNGTYEESGKTIIHLFAAQPDTYRVNMKVLLNNGSEDSISKDVYVHPLAQVNFIVDNLCQGQSALYQDNSSITYGSISQYYWDFDNDGVVDDNSGPNVYFTVGTATTYQTKLTCITDNGCSSFAVKTAQAFPQPTVSFIASSSEICEEEPVTFTNNSSVNNDNISLNIWEFGDGNQQVSASNPSHEYTTSGNYTVRLIAVTDNFCSDTAEMNITVNPLPPVSIELSGDTVFFDDESLTITVSGDAGSSYFWSTGETASSITVNETGAYTVTATNVFGCEKTLSQEVVVNKLKDVDVKSDIITPNSDGMNDFLTIENIEEYGTCELTVYNIWNDVVYSSIDYQNNWDGTNKSNKPLDAGTYYYIIKCTDDSKQMGSINILR